ncbi:C2 family cysteine protease [Fluoribacter dumoffii]|uniref:Calpain family cysteine protease n=1 Tax=Fluoribacter dumoffii TaxID=463 RepID=A0A377G7R1_9GAMM|nr:C2 family cysteine protease [Fluoribacter dumoffii]KTC92392.1 coiled-coil protein [Fluoribacter dumoffii NY 23]STO20378.1 Calpain family cysteine protease [Fluoribacter dumoffii]
MEDDLEFTTKNSSVKTVPVNELKTSPNPKGVYGFFSIHHEKSVAPLYPQRLSIAHVAQGALSGDCYLLSVINAILALPKGEHYFRKIMIDKNNKIYVRFFKDDEPQWLVMEKSLPKYWGILSSGKIWVRFLEKAYITFMGGNYNKILNSGDSRKVLKALLGGFSEPIPLPKQANCPLAQLHKKIIYGCNGKDIYSLIFLLRPYDKLASVTNMVESIFAGEQTLLEGWWNWVRLHQHQLAHLLEEHVFLTKETFIHFIQQLADTSIDPPLRAIGAVFQWLQQYKILPGENEYSYDEMNLFLSLKKAQEEQKPIVCSSREDPPEGITMWHTYALLDVKESHLSYRKFITLRNPHHENRNWLSHYLFYGGRYSMEREVNGKVELVILPVKESTFTMELRDFAQAFAYIDCGRSLVDNKLLQQENNPALFEYG